MPHHEATPANTVSAHAASEDARVHTGDSTQSMAKKKTALGRAFYTPQNPSEDASHIFDKAMALIESCEQLERAMSLLVTAGAMGHPEAHYVAGSLLLHGPSAHASAESDCNEMSASAMLAFESYFGSTLTPTENHRQPTADPTSVSTTKSQRSASRIGLARNHFEAAAALGHGKSLRKLAVMDASGMTLELSQPQSPSASATTTRTSSSASASSSLGLYHLAAVHGDTEAQLALAHRYHRGIGGAEHDCETAAFYYMAVADKSLAESTMGGAETIHDHVLLTAKAEDAGVDKGEKGEDDELIAYQRLRAEEGHVPSIMAMGDLYYYGGRGIVRDQAQALQYFQQAAGAPHFDDGAEVAVGNLFLKGEGTEANLTAAMMFYEKAAAKNNTRALNGLGFLYYHGNEEGGLKPNRTRAFKLFLRAANSISALR